jgi:hypothetical protein
VCELSPGPAQRQPSSRLKVAYDGKATRISFDDQDQAGRPRPLHARDRHERRRLCRGPDQAIDHDRRGRPWAGEEALNFVTAIVKEVAPRDQVEAKLAIEMTAVHLATVTFAQRLAHVEAISQQHSAERALNKLPRSFLMQVEALKR